MFCCFLFLTPWDPNLKLLPGVPWMVYRCTKKVGHWVIVSGKEKNWALWISASSLRTASMFPCVLIQILFAVCCDMTRRWEALVTNLNSREKGRHHYSLAFHLAIAIPEGAGQMAPLFSGIPVGSRPQTLGCVFLLLPPTATVSVFSSLVFQHH